MAYLGEEGYGVNIELQDGKEHSQGNTSSFLKKSIDNARRATSAKLLVRMNSGFDSIDNIKICIKECCDHLIKRNLRKESKEDWLIVARKHGLCVEERPGNKVYMGERFFEEGLEQPLRVILK